MDYAESYNHTHASKQARKRHKVVVGPRIVFILREDQYNTHTHTHIYIYIAEAYSLCLP